MNKKNKVFKFFIIKKQKPINNRVLYYLQQPQQQLKIYVKAIFQLFLTLSIQFIIFDKVLKNDEKQFLNSLYHLEYNQKNIQLLYFHYRN